RLRAAKRVIALRGAAVDQAHGGRIGLDDVAEGREGGFGGTYASTADLPGGHAVPKIPVITLFQELDFNIGDLEIDVANKKKMVLVDDQGFTITFKGQELDYRAGIIVDGHITGFAVRDSEGALLETITALDFDAGTVSAETMRTYISTMATRIISDGVKLIGSDASETLKLLGGDDFIFGGKGEDFISGGEGKDHLTGGPGSDVFVYDEGMGKDIITDFNPGGPGIPTQDHFDADFPGEDAITKSGKHDTLINFGDGDKFLLLGVKPGQIDTSDFGIN
ncbi:hypothetical protein FGG08_007679, partial [Glutinoglossum americanum]